MSEKNYNSIVKSKQCFCQIPTDILMKWVDKRYKVNRSTVG